MLRIVAAVALLVVATTSGSAQDQQRPPFRAVSDIVPVYVTVTGRDGQLIPGLVASDFTLIDSGKPREITMFSPDRRPVAVALVLDTTMSMQAGQGMARSFASAAALAEALDPDDYVSVGVMHREIADLTKDKRAVARLLRQPATNWMSPTVIEAVNSRGLDWAIESLRQYDGRRVVVMFTDGQSRGPNDRAADLFLVQDPIQAADQLVLRANQADVAIHAIGFDDTRVEEMFLSSFVKTGGGGALVTRDADLGVAFREFVEDLHHEYLLGFTPVVFDGKSHKIEVKVNRPGAKVRSRTSYIADKR